MFLNLTLWGYGLQSPLKLQDFSLDAPDNGLYLKDGVDNCRKKFESLACEPKLWIPGNMHCLVFGPKFNVGTIYFD